MKFKKIYSKLLLEEYELCFFCQSFSLSLGLESLRFRLEKRERREKKRSHAPSSISLSILQNKVQERISLCNIFNGVNF